MNPGYGIGRQSVHTQEEHDRPARYLVIIESGGSPVARLFLDNREPVAEFDAGADEVALMTKELMPGKTASLPEWDRALAGHSGAERAAAEVYTLDV